LATDATGTPTSPDSIPKFNTAVDAPSGLGSNAQMDSIQTALSARVSKPSGIASGETAIWNGTGWDRSSVTKLTASNIANGIAGSQISGYPSDGTKAFFGDGTWKVPSAGVAPTFLGVPQLFATYATPNSNTAYLSPIFNLTVATTLTRLRMAINVSSGNLDLGIYYSDDESTFTRYFSMGSTASPGTGVRTFTIASQTITPVAGRRWYFAFAADNATIAVGQFSLVNLPDLFLKATSFPLPSSLTGMTASTTIANIWGLV
jgi:hypothetical protein